VIIAVGDGIDDGLTERFLKSGAHMAALIRQFGRATSMRHFGSGRDII
jgi:hypothetical protein